MNQSFENKPTSSLNKINTEFYADDCIKLTIQKFKGQYMAGLVGCAIDLDRHLNRWNALGFTNSRIIIFEHDYKTFLSLQAEIKRRNLKCKVFNECFLNGTQRLAKLGTKFAYFEFDGVCQYGFFEFQLYKIAKNLNVPVLVCQGSSRGQIKEVKNLSKKWKMSSFLNNGYKCFNLIPTAKRILSQKLRGYQNEIFTYQGISNMYMQISIRKGCV